MTYRIRNVFAAACLTGLLSPAVLSGSALASTIVPDGVPGHQADAVVEAIEPGAAVAGRYLAARHAESVGDFVSAADITSEIVSELPDNGTIKRRVHLLMVSAGRIDRAAELADEVLAEQPGDPLAVYTIYNVALHEERHEDAAALLPGVPESGVNSILKPMLLAWAQAGAGQYDTAFASLEELAAMPGLEPMVGMHQALIADIAGDAAKADAAFARALETSNGQPSLQLVDSFARFLMREERQEEAQALVAKFVEDNPDTLLTEPVRSVVAGERPAERLIAGPREGAAEVFRNVAGLLNRERLQTEALLFIRLSLDLEPDNATGLFTLAQLLDARARPDLAIDVYRKIAPVSPYHWYARLSIAEALHTEERAEEAIAILREMIPERPARFDAARTLADVLRIEKRFEDAIEVYDLAFERIDGPVDWQLLYTRGIALERAKKWERAEKDFLAALDIDPDQPLVLNYLGYSWVEQGVQLERAKEMIETAVAKRPEDGYITDSLGWVLYRLGEYEQAVDLLERAVSLEPGDFVINDHLGDAYWLVGRRDEARFQWQRALTLDPDDDVMAEILRKLSGETRPEPNPPGKKRDI